MKEMSWSLLFGVVVVAVVSPVLSQQTLDDASYLMGDTGGSDETDNQLYDEMGKRALLALSRFRPFASAFTRSPALFPDPHRYAARSFLSGMDANSLSVAARSGRPPQNPMRFGR